jgi:hypothetical protein
MMGPETQKPSVTNWLAAAAVVHTCQAINRDEIQLGNFSVPSGNLT